MRQQSPMGPDIRGSQLNFRSASYSGLQEDSRSVPQPVTRKKETIDSFKSKLNRLEKNKTDLENKMKLFDAKVKAHTVTQSITSTL